MLEDLLRADRNRRMGVRIGELTGVDGSRVNVSFGAAEVQSVPVVTRGRETAYAGQRRVFLEVEGQFFGLGSIGAQVGQVTPEVETL